MNITDSGKKTAMSKHHLRDRTAEPSAWLVQVLGVGVGLVTGIAIVIMVTGVLI